ncbi:hypothetical protein [Catenuloplanes japonicus]|uniref:hypothetical protein n=1 Tax=Catenuloplanes japonicus TaxID=33876 RepID=UPI0012F7D706|nr:hypothetical protein [Catenuloplanes japonicus]
MAPDVFRTFALCDRGTGEACGIRFEICGNAQPSGVADPAAQPDTDAQPRPRHVALSGSALIVVHCAGVAPTDAASTSGAERLVFSLAEVARMTGFSERGVERDCRAGKVRHVHRGQTRGMTRADRRADRRLHVAAPATGHASYRRAVIGGGRRRTHPPALARTALTHLIHGTR